MQFAITIQAPREKVWDTLWNDATYQAWTAPFAEGSRAVSDWQEGSKILFLGDKDSGMTSVIASKKPYEFMSFKHLGIVKNGVEDFDSPESKEWAGATENYTLKEAAGSTELTVTMDEIGINQQMLDYFNNAWPKALDTLKKIAEN